MKRVSKRPIHMEKKCRETNAYEKKPTKEAYIH